MKFEECKPYINLLKNQDISDMSGYEFSTEYFLPIQYAMNDLTVNHFNYMYKYFMDLVGGIRKDVSVKINKIYNVGIEKKWNPVNICIRNGRNSISFDFN